LIIFCLPTDAGKKTPSSAVEFVASGDADSLQAHLENMVRKNDAERLTKRLKQNNIMFELSEEVDGRSALHWAIYLNHTDAVSVLLAYAKKDGDETFDKAMMSMDDNGDSPCASAIRNNNLECIMVSLFPNFQGQKLFFFIPLKSFFF
jgi:hypothetical protein